MWGEFKEPDRRYRESDLPKVSIIIPTLNSSPLIASTLESILIQDYPDIEVIMIDAGSLDRTLEVVKSLKDARVRIYSVSEYSRFTMLNKGITHAYGTYVNFMFPGDLYIHKLTLREMMILALDHNKPALVYSGTLLRYGKSEVKILYRPFTLPLLCSGKQPTALQSCWFRCDIFRKLGKFNTTYEYRAGFELLCRIGIDETYSIHSTHRILTDFDLRFITRTTIIHHFLETMKIINHYFGLWAVFVWLFKQNDTRYFFRLWWRSLRLAFLGK